MKKMLFPLKYHSFISEVRQQKSEDRILFFLLSVIFYLSTVICFLKKNKALFQHKGDLKGTKFPSCYGRSPFTPGFTLIELLIVLVIIGIGFMSVTPKIFENAANPNKRVQFFNDLLDKYGKVAAMVSHPVLITGYKSSSRFVVDESEFIEPHLDGGIKTLSGKSLDNVVLSGKKEVEYYVPADSGITSVEINGEKTFNNKFEIFIYPDKLCDHFIINFNDDKSVESIPLLLKVQEI